MPTNTKLTTEQVAALRTFATANGRRWKAALRLAWETGRYDDFNGTDDSASLQQVRNAFGPSWLKAFRLEVVA